MAVRRKLNDAAVLSQLLFDELTVGSDVLDRARFFYLSQGLSDGDLETLRRGVESRVARYYDGVASLVGKGRSGRDAASMVSKELDSWFRPWTRLAGRIEYDVEEHLLRGDVLDEGALSSLLVGYSRLPEYAPYLEKEFKGFVSNRCLEYRFDYSKMAPELRTPDLMEAWEVRYPYLLESHEWPLLGKAYSAGSPREVVLGEPPSLANGFIGGKIAFNSYFVLARPVTVSPDAAVTAIAQIDYKDCTNAFVVLGSDARAVPFDALEKNQKTAVLERVFDTLKYSKKYRMCNRPAAGPKI